MSAEEKLRSKLKREYSAPSKIKELDLSGFKIKTISEQLGKDLQKYKNV